MGESSDETKYELQRKGKGKGGSWLRFHGLHLIAAEVLVVQIL